MTYNFDEIIDRKNTNATKIDGFRQYIFKAGPEAKFAYSDEEFIQMWLADMELAVAPEICDAMKARIDKKIFGYTKMFSPSFYEAFSAWCREKYDWGFPREELVFSDGVVSAFYQLSELILQPGEKILIHTPAYGHFEGAAKYNHVELVTSPLVSCGGRFEIDFEDFEKKAADPKVRVFIFCNPHNPTGRIWTEEELKKMAEIIEKYDLWVISDEIHCDLLRVGNRHIPMGKIMPEYQKLVTCMSASKTFNLAGLRLSNIMIRDAGLRKKWEERDKGLRNVNPVSAAAHEAAYKEGGAWLEQLRAYLDENFRYVKEVLTEQLPEVEFEIPEATYLGWANFNAYLGDLEDLPLFFANQAGVLVEGGDALFVGNAKGYVRLNVALPKALLKEGMERICKAVKAHVGKEQLS